MTEELRKKISDLNLKAVLFDMDGVIFNSMPYHAKAWVDAFASVGIEFDAYNAYLREGMTGFATINELFLAQKGRVATEEECKKIYNYKCKIFDSFGPAEPIEGIRNVLKTVQDAGLEIFIVTGSGQQSLFDKLDHYFPGVFHPDRMVTAHDVKKGKPDPEPYLMALAKGGYLFDEAIVVENAPQGVLAGVSAGIFTVAVNTGILKPEDLLEKGADVLYNNMYEFNEALQDFIELGIKK